MYMKYLDLLIKSFKDPNKFFFVLSKKLFSIPDLNSLNKIQSKFIKKKYFNLWINLSKKNFKFNKLFFEDEKKEEKMKFELDILDKLDENIFKSLASNGVVILENALPNEEMEKIQNDFDELKKKELSNTTFNKSDWLTNPIKTETQSKIRIYSKKNITNYPYLEKLSDKITKEISGKTLKTEAEFYLDKCKQLPEEKVIGDNILHIDRWVPNFKLIYSPFEVNIENAPFTYLLQSHKINKIYKKMILDNNFQDIEKNQLYDLKKTTKILLKENSLVVALTNGIHGRSPFLDLKERMLVFLQYARSFNKLSFFNYRSFNK
jgi:hypothetical protein